MLMDINLRGANKKIFFFIWVMVLTACGDRDIKDEVFYFVMPDRFNNGVVDNDRGGVDGSREEHGFDATDKRYYHGGDLVGLKEKLPYLKKMGVSAIWMTPIFKNLPVASGSAAYHGYWVVDYTQVDPHLGTNQALKQLIQQAHKLGLRVYFDVVVNHTADVIKYAQCHDSQGNEVLPCPYRDTSQTPYTAFIPEGRQDIKQPAWLNDVELYNNRGNSTFSGESSRLGDFFGLDDLNTENPQVVSGMTDIFKYWIKEFNIDGFRLDAVKHVDMSFWQQWTPEIIQYAKSEGIEDFFVFGEIFDGSPKNISRYTTAGEIPSALDFGLYFAMRDVFANDAAPTRLADMLAQDDWYNGVENDASTLLSFVSNHDLGRLTHWIKQAHPAISDDEHLARLQQAYALMYFGRGIPVIYYGDEQGFAGGEGDIESREDMMPSLVESDNRKDLIGTELSTADNNFDIRHPMYRMFQRYKKILDHHTPLRRGDQYIRYASNEPGIFALARVDKENPHEYLVVMNTATEEKSISLPATSSIYQQLLPKKAYLEADRDHQIHLTVPALSTIILFGIDRIESPALEAVTLNIDNGHFVSGRFEVPVELSWASDSPIHLVEVNVELSLDGVEFATVGRDVNPDYRVYVDADKYANGTELILRATAIGQTGEKLVSDPVSVVVGVSPEMTVYFHKPASWSESINVYYWNADPAPGVEWPGLAMESLGDNWYRFALPEGVSSANLIFNDGQHQTVDLYRDGSGCYVANEWTDTCDVPELGIEFIFKKPGDWGEDIHLYYWDAAPAPAVDWPGIAMQNIAQGWYRIRLPAGAQSANVIFNDGQGNQTADLFRNTRGCYGVDDSTWTDNCDIVEDITINGARAHWVDADTLIWPYQNTEAVSFKLYTAYHASIEIQDRTVVGADAEFDLFSGAVLDADLASRFPHLAQWPVFSLNATQETIERALKGQLVVAALNREGELLDITKVQIPGVLDDLFTYSGQLGVVLESGAVNLRLWAPTAQRVVLKRYDSNLQLIATHAPEAVSNGVYFFSGDAQWVDQFYRYELTVFHPENSRIETYEVTDPYSIGLSMDSRFSQIIDLANDDSIKPEGWDNLVKQLPDDSDMSIYEGHIRDFSIFDLSVPKAHRGKYLAFTYSGDDERPVSSGMSHLTALQQSGLTHFQMLPANDIASIREDVAHRVDLDDPFSALCRAVNVIAIQESCEEFGDLPIVDVFSQLQAADPLNERLQALNYDDRTRGFSSVDGFNWGYDPYHFMVSEGSYATEPQGKQRVLEFRQMVKALSDIGLNVALDVVFNHTSASGLQEKSVLDKVVPGYYHRLNAQSGAIARSTCCENTAAEHAMMEKLIIDTLKIWAQYYKIDAFRFDLMGHHPKSTMENIRRALAELNPGEHGVQGNKIYLYGEGWDFGEVSGDQRFEQATQRNMAGTGIGTFNDRLRDAVRGGNFTDNGRAQGFANGNEIYVNHYVDGAASLNDQADRIRIGLAGNLQGYTFEDNNGVTTTGARYANVGYTLDPQENIVYVDKHDNETLWDNTQAKLPDNLDMSARVRVHAFSQALVNFSQGIPFFQMGSDLLRSKSMDRNSFDSGDWFNKVDFTLETNNWAVGMPPLENTGNRWDEIRQIMGNPNINPGLEHIQLATDLFQEQLAIRYSTPLLRLNSSEHIHRRLGFWNTGASQTPGLIAMTISDGICAGEDLDPALDGLVVLFNADDERVNFSLDALAGQSLELHRIQKLGVDEHIKTSTYQKDSATFSVPARSVAVFVRLQSGAQAVFPCNPQFGLATTPGFTTYFEKPDSWSDAYIYYWNTLPATEAVAWPGVAMNNLGENWHDFTFPDGVTEANIIFHNNAGEQTDDLYRRGDGCFDVVSTSWTPTCDLPGLQLWFEKPSHWSDNVYLYFWGGATAGADWPGTLMQSLDDRWYTFQMPDGVREMNLIFNDAGASGSGEQSNDLFRSSNGCYSLDSGWSNACTPP